MSETAVVYYHSGDADGVFSGWAARHALILRGLKPEDIHMRPVGYGDGPDDTLDHEDIVIVTDFTFEGGDEKYDDMRGFVDIAGEFVWIDHHASTQDLADELISYPYDTIANGGLKVVHDQDYAACVLTWQTMVSEYVPGILLYVSDRDLWKFDLPHSDAVNLYIGMQDIFSGNWDRMTKLAMETDIGAARQVGSLLVSYRDGFVERMCSGAELHDFGEKVVPMVNTTVLQSEVGHRLLQLYPDSPFAVSFSVSSDQSETKYSLRSRGDYDVSVLAAEHGGGGHPSAAGFTVDY